MKKFYMVLLYIIIFSYPLACITEIFWEKEKNISSRNIGKFEVFNNDKIIGVVYADISNKFSLYLKYSKDGNKWSSEVQVVKKFFSNNPQGVDFTTSIDSEDNLYICYRVNKTKFSLVRFPYPYKEKKAEKIIQIESDNIIYLPKIFIDSRRDIHLLYSTNEENIFRIKYKKITSTGKILIENTIGKNLKSSLNPMILENKGILYIVFQAKDDEVRSGYFYNIFLAYSKNKGETWAYKRVITSEGENNQGPFMLINNQKCLIAWEKEDNKFISHIYYKSFNLDLDIHDKELLISDKESEAHSPYIVVFNDNVNIFWYDNQSKRFQNYFTQVFEDEVFEANLLKPKEGRTLSNKPVIFKDDLVFFWVQSYKKNVLYYLNTDTYVESPKIKARNISSSRLLNRDSIKLQWDLVTDVSDVKGYRALLTNDKDEEISDNTTLIYYLESRREYKNLEDGKWYFKLKAYDNAGNKSEESVYSFTIDTISPLPPVLIDPPFNEDGTLTNNSPIIKWEDSNESLKSFRYYYKLFTDKKWNEVQLYKSISHAADFKFITDRSLKFDSLDNGILLVGVQGYDNAGNLSEISWKQYVLNDYIPVTYISYITSKIRASGENLFQIYGRGFKVDGNVQAVYIDKDKKEPYDYIIPATNFKVNSDRFIQQIKELKVEDGSYYIGVEHPIRGVKFYKNKSKFTGEWVFRYGDENYFSFNRVLFLTQRQNLTKWIFLISGFFWIVIVLILLQAMMSIVRERVYVKKLLVELKNIKTQMTYLEYKKRRDIVKKKGIGLTVKYTFLILSLVIIIVSATSITLSALALKNETKNLANEMKERATLVMTNYETTMLDIYTYEKGFTEAVDATVNIATLPDIGFAMFREVNKTIFMRYGEKSNVFFKGINLDEITDEEKEKIIVEKIFTNKTKEDIKSFKKKYDGNEKIYPDFNPSKLLDKYIFIKPIIIDDGNNKKYIAEIAVGYSFEKILQLINQERLSLITTTIVVTLIAILISIVGSVFLATTTIRPIKKMSKHVNVISTTDDYEKLLGTENEKIEINTGDEIGILASSINDMTSKLIEKAKADKQMMLGKEIQKKFIPLEPHETEYIDIFGFYEGAKGVSGDYFDYKKLDDDHYAFIICDVAGKAVPAALIMVQISTIFHSFYAHFDAKKNKFETVSIVNQINDTVAERGFSGRFAAILVVILNVKTGKALLTNAGYTQLLVYRDVKGKAEIIKLNIDSGAAGVFPSYMLPNPYVQEQINIDKRDIIFLFTDGIEESRNGEMITNEKGEKQPEEFGLARIKSILNKSGGKSPREMINFLIDQERIFRGDFEQYDDLTILGIKRK